MSKIINYIQIPQNVYYFNISLKVLVPWAISSFAPFISLGIYLCKIGFTYARLSNSLTLAPLSVQPWAVAQARPILTAPLFIKLLNKGCGIRLVITKQVSKDPWKHRVYTMVGKTAPDIKVEQKQVRESLIYHTKYCQTRNKKQHNCAKFYRNQLSFMI